MTKKLEYDDEQLFQVLPTPEEWERIKKDLSAFKFSTSDDEPRECKWVMIDKTHWFNYITKKKGTVYNIVIAAFCDDSARSHAINEIHEQEYDREESSWKTINKWVFNKEYAHINMNRDGYSKTLYVERDEEDNIWLRRYVLFYQDVCCPITQHHFFVKDEEELTKIFKGQLMGQNNNSPFQTVVSVKNNYPDRAVVLRDSGEKIKANAPVVQLLVRKRIEWLRDPQNMRDALQGIKLPPNDDYVMVKRMVNDYYTCEKKSELTDEVMFNEVSHYYPVITYEETKHITDSIPKTEIDFSCIGVGSAGTGILDQVVRGNWFNSYLLVDPDDVELKNVRNQWYTRGQRGVHKADACRAVMQNIYNTDNAPQVYAKNCRFQEAGLDNYVSKYIVSGFDSIECRLELLNDIMEGKHQAQYLIDTRYDDLSASVFFIDMADEKQVEYYKKGLESDLEAFNEIQAKELEARRITTWEAFLDYLRSKGCFHYNCSSMQKEIAGFCDDSCDINTYDDACGGAKCLAFWKRIWEEKKDELKLYKPEEQQESSCVKQNFIDIYKYASSFVFAAIREIESGNPKPFTHIEASTDVLPKSMVLRR